MSIALFWKLFGDLCLYFSLVGALPALFYHDYSFLWPTVLCSLGGTAASLILFHTKRGHRAWAIILPLLSLLLASNLMEFLILLPPIIYTAAVIVRGDFLLEYHSFREYFRKSCTVWLVLFAVLFLWSSAESLTRPWAAVISLEDPLRYGVLYAVSGVILLRQLRMGYDSGSMDRKMNNAQTAAMLAGSGAVVALMVAAEYLINRYGKEILNTIGQILLTVIGIPISVLGWLLERLLGDLTLMYQELPESTDPTATTDYAPDGIIVQPPVITDTVTEPAAFPWWLAIVILIVLTVVLLVAVRLLRSKAKSGSSQTVFDRVILPERKAKQSAASNRAKVRRYYREHLKTERRKGLLLRRDQTSADILKKIAPDTDAGAAARLRNIYLKARYDEAAEITAQDAADAKNALKKLKES